MNCADFENDKCAVCNCNKIIIAAEKKCKFILKNPKQEKICKIRVDGCYIKDGKKCDYLIIACKSQKVFLIELKGNSLMDAIKQILITLESLEPKLKGNQINARIVLTKVNVPNMENNPHINTLKKILKKNGGTLAKKTIVLEENI